MFFAMNTVGIEQEAVSLLNVSSLFPAGKQPHKPCVCSCSGSRCKCFSCFHLGSLTWTHDTPPLSNPSICHCAHTEQLLQGFGLGGGSQFLKSWFWFFFSYPFYPAQISVIMNKKSSCYAHCVWGDFTHLHSHSTHSQHVN